MSSVNDIPVVIVHRSYKEYLKINLLITGLKNKIYLIGDTEIENLGRLDNVTFININKYEKLPMIKESYDKFINYSSNSKQFEWLCFERIFIINFFMKEFNFERIFHIDSDNILLKDINTYPFEKKIAYCITKNWHKNRMSNSVHNGLLNLDFCDKFIDLFNDIYINKSKFHLIEEKINYHKEEKGGICDMTLYYLLVKEKILNVQNLLTPKNNIVFINNINNGEGEESKEQYELNNNIINININNNKCFVYDKIHKKNLEIFNIHFQGTSKRLLNSNLITLLSN